MELKLSKITDEVVCGFLETKAFEAEWKRQHTPINNLKVWFWKKVIICLQWGLILVYSGFYKLNNYWKVST